MTIPKEFECDLCPEAPHWPRVRFNFDNGWSASVIFKTRPDLLPPEGCLAMQASVACCPTGQWNTGVSELGGNEATADEVAAYLAFVAARPRP